MVSLVEHLCVLWQHHKRVAWRAIGWPLKKIPQAGGLTRLGSTRNGYNSLRDADGLYEATATGYRRTPVSLQLRFRFCRVVVQNHRLFG